MDGVWSLALPKDTIKALKITRIAVCSVIIHAKLVMDPMIIKYEKFNFVQFSFLPILQFFSAHHVMEMRNLKNQKITNIAITNP